MKKANRILAALMLVVLALSFTGCASENGYEQVVDKYCRALQNNDFNCYKSIIDWDNEEFVLKAFDLCDDKTEAEEYNKKAFVNEHELTGNQLGDHDFTAEHGQIKVLKDGHEDYALERLQKLVKLRNEAEDAETTRFVNDFVANLKYVAVVKTNITIRSKKDSSKKDRAEMHAFTYCYKGKWYIDGCSEVLTYVVGILNTREKLAGTDDSGDDGWG